MEKTQEESKRSCPGERYEIPVAICNARQANGYPKCLLCSYYSGTIDEFASGDPKIKKNIFRSNIIAGEVPGEINEYVMRKLGSAAGQLLRARMGSKRTAMIACDRRENSRNLSRIFGEGMGSAGVRAVHLGPAMPDMLRFAMKKHDTCSAVFISGCNAAQEINGIRLIEPDGRPVVFESGIEKIGLIARRMKPGRSASHDKSKTVRILPDFRDFVLQQSPQLQPLKVVVDGSCGTGGEVLPYVLAKTPLSVIKSHCQPDPRSELLGLRFPAGQVNNATQQAIQTNGAHLGMAADYDGDLCTFYDEEGRALRSDIAAALIAKEILEIKPGARIAYDLRSTAAVREEVLRGNGQPLRTSSGPGPLGETIVAKGAEYAFDINGRHCFRAFQGGESPLLALILLCSAVLRNQTRLSALSQNIGRYAYSGVIRHEMPSPEKAAAALEEILDSFTDCEKDELDGFTFRFPSWWLHVKYLRGSRIIKTCLEGRTEEEEKAGRNRVEEIIRKYQDRR